MPDAAAQGGTAEDPYQITGAAELIWLRDAVNAGEANTCAELQQDVEYVDEVWTSIGTSEHPYTGTFNGNGHTIRVWLNGWGQALFGYVGADAKLTGIAVQKHQSENYSISDSAPLARSNAGTITHCRYSGGKTEDQFRGGEVAYLLNGGTARDDWRQNCYAGDSSDATPVLDRSHAQVRKSGSSYVSLYPHVHCICGGDATSGGHPQHSDVT